MTISFSVAVLSGELRKRVPMTLKCIESINNQTFPNIQKILVNGGNPPHQTLELIEKGAKLDDWILVDFPIDTMESSSIGSHQWTGNAALHVATGDYFFSINDDDFLAGDFFERIEKLLLKYPSAISAMGLPIVYNHDLTKYSSRTIPVDINNNRRLEFEPGIDVVRKIFFTKKNTYQPALGFQPVIKTKYIKEVSSTIFNAGFPDFSSYFQLVSRGDSVFDLDAYMYWGKHTEQHNIRMTTLDYWKPHYAQKFKIYSDINVRVFKKFLPDYKKEAKLIVKFFNRLSLLMALHAIKTFYVKEFPDINNLERLKNSFRIISHFKTVISNPLIFLQWILDKYLTKID